MSSSPSSSSSSPSRKRALLIACLITLWYSSNIGVILLNKYLLSNYGFRFPIFLTMCHMTACALLSYASIVFLKLVPLQVKGPLFPCRFIGFGSFQMQRSLAVGFQCDVRLLDLQDACLLVRPSSLDLKLVSILMSESSNYKFWVRACHETFGLFDGEILPVFEPSLLSRIVPTH